MSDKFTGHSIKAGSTSVSIWFSLDALADGSGVSGKVAADLTAYYIRQGGTATSITLSNLAAVNSAYSSGGVKEIDATNMKGLYRLDLPDAALATGADEVAIVVQEASSFSFRREYVLDVAIGAAQTKTSGLTYTTSNKVDATIQAAGDFAQGAADKVWSTAARSLTTFGSLVSDVTTAIWTAGSRTLTSFGGLVASIVAALLDEPRAGHVASGTVGEAISAAGSAADPLLNAVPGSYAAGTAGAALGTVANTSLIPAIKTVTDQITFPSAGLIGASVTLDASAF